MDMANTAEPLMFCYCGNELWNPFASRRDRTQDFGAPFAQITQRMIRARKISFVDDHDVGNFQ
jgi:hypothetical protein